LIPISAAITGLASTTINAMFVCKIFFMTSPRFSSCHDCSATVLHLTVAAQPHSGIFQKRKKVPLKWNFTSSALLQWQNKTILEWCSRIIASRCRELNGKIKLFWNGTVKFAPPC
jgi:hypothetical protein